MLMNGKANQLSSNQQGFAAFVIAIVLVLVLGLITVGFAELMRKEQRSALDKHLSSQAYYAAEAGINDATKAVNSGYSKMKTDCAPLPASDTTPGGSSLKSGQIGGAEVGVSYTCLLIDPTPTTLEYGPSNDTQSKIVELTGVDKDDTTVTLPISYVVFSWEDPERRTEFASSDQRFRPSGGAGAWSSNTGMLRIGLTPLTSGGINRAYFKANTHQSFLYPNGPGGVATSPASYSAYAFSESTGDKGGTILNGNCNVNSKPRFCNVRINLGDAAQANLLLSLRWVYSPSRVTIQAYDSNDNRLRIKNAQTLVDSTGKAQDVLRRIQVRVPVRSNYNHTDYALETMEGICKQLEVFPDSASRGSCN